MNPLDTAPQDGMERVGIYKPSDVLPFVVAADVTSELFKRGLKRSSPEFRAVIEREYNGHFVKMDSLRYQLFSTKGLRCVRCGIEGSFFSLERNTANTANNPDRYHFNLYGLEPDGTWVLITKDHIIPASKGGKDKLSNMQVMCTKCNKLKAANKRVKQVLVFIKDGKVERAYSDDELEVVVASRTGFEVCTPVVSRKALVHAAKEWGQVTGVDPAENLLDLAPHK